MQNEISYRTTYHLELVGGTDRGGSSQ